MMSCAVFALLRFVRGACEDEVVVVDVEDGLAVFWAFLRGAMLDGRIQQWLYGRWWLLGELGV